MILNTRFAVSLCAPDSVCEGNVIANLIGYEDSNQPLKHEPQAIGFFDGPLVHFLVEKNVILTNGAPIQVTRHSCCQVLLAESDRAWWSGTD